MTRRERLERKLELRAEWAAKAEARSARRFESARKVADGIPFGQPILVGHHSERHHRADLARIEGNMRKGCEESALAKHHESKADGLSAQLDRCIFSDDENAIEAIREKIAGMEKERDAMKRANAVFKKGGRDALAAECGDAMAKAYDDLRRVCPWETRPFPPYSLTNLGANIRRMEKRIEEIQRRQARAKAAEDAGGVAITGTGDYIGVTFAEKPERAILDALRAAGFFWSGGSWRGQRAKLPASVAELVAAPAEAGPRCGCPVNAPEADPAVSACPCGSHCSECVSV